MPGTRIGVKPIDLLAAIRYLRYTKARVSPRGLRFEFAPGEDAKLVLEPWNMSCRSKARRNYQAKTRAVWGRRR